MDLNQVPNDPMINGVKIEEKIVGNFDDELQCSRSKINIVEEQSCSKEVEVKQLELELEIWNKYMKLEAINGKIRVLGDEKLGIEEEIMELKRKKAALAGEEEVGGEFSANETDEMSRINQFMVENKVLECEKNDVITKGENWEQKCKELSLSMLALLERLKSRGKDGGEGGFKGATVMSGDHVCLSKDSGSPSCLPGVEGSPDKPHVVTEGTAANKVRVKKRLAYQTERCCDEKIAPPTPAEGKHSTASVIDIIDSDNEGDGHPSQRPCSKSEGNGDDVRDMDGTVDGINYGEEQNNNRGAASFVLTPRTKRKRDLLVVTSDDEGEDHGCTPSKRALKIENSDTNGEDDDDDDNITITRVSKRLTSESDDDIPICRLIKRRAPGSTQPAGTSNSTRPKRRLVKRGQSEKKDEVQENESHPDKPETENAANDDESSDEDSDGSVRSLGSFIVDDDEVEDDEYDNKEVEEDVLEGDGGDDSFEMEEGSDDDVDFEDIISKLQSRRHPSSKWTSEGDMLSDFGKNPDLCLRAVCALYRQQTNEEKACKASIVHNGRGFSKFDATRGSRLGEFLTDGDPKGDLVKSVEELQKYYRGGLEECRRLADHYSKQLFRIYKSGEDPFFP